jgi:hypothetical protein
VLRNLPARHTVTAHVAQHESGGPHVYMASAAPQPVPATHMPVTPMGAQVMSVRAEASANPVTPVSDGGSLLGMAQDGSAN